LEVNRPIDAIAFIGHSLETGQNNPDNPDFSIGMMFYYPVNGPFASTLLPEIFPQRDITPDDLCIPGAGFQNCLFPLQKRAPDPPNPIASYKNILEIGAPPFLNPPRFMGKVIDRIPRQARVVFIGSCEIQDELLKQDSPFLQLWDIHNAGTDSLEHVS